MTNDRIFSLVLTVFQSADCLPEQLMFCRDGLALPGGLYFQTSFIYGVTSFIFSNMFIYGETSFIFGSKFNVKAMVFYLKSNKLFSIQTAFHISLIKTRGKMSVLDGFSWLVICLNIVNNFFFESFCLCTVVSRKVFSFCVNFIAGYAMNRLNFCFMTYVP